MTTGLHSHHRGAVDHQPAGLDVVFDPHVGGRDRPEQTLHQECAGGPVDLGFVAPGRGPHRVAEGPGILATGVDETGVGGRLEPRLRVELALERHPVLHEPPEVIERVVAVHPDLLDIGVGATRGHEELEHRLRVVRHVAGLLHLGPTTEIDEAAGEGRRAAARSRRLEHERVGTSGGGRDRRARPRGAQSDDHHVGLEVPPRDLRSIQGCDIGPSSHHAHVSRHPADERTPGRRRQRP